MNKRLTIALLILALASIAAGQTGVRNGPIVRQVDRILIESGNAKGLFEFFSRDLQLPEAWPLAENQGHISGGLGAGNATIEIYEYVQRKRVPTAKIALARFAGLALEPYPLEDALREMKACGILFDPPQPAISILPDGKRGVAWTTVPLPSFSKSGLSIFLYEYSQAFLKVDVRRKQLGNRLTLTNGGPLGIQSVREVVLSAAQFRDEHAGWQRLLGSQTPSGNWTLGTGPAIRVVSSSQDRIQRLVIQVRSLTRARAFLKKLNLLGPESAGETYINPSGIQGLRISLVE
jgi:hypothetical protein